MPPFPSCLRSRYGPMLGGCAGRGGRIAPSRGAVSRASTGGTASRVGSSWITSRSMAWTRLRRYGPTRKEDAMTEGRRLAGVSGIVYVVLSLVVGLMVPPPPTLETPAHEVVAYFAAHRQPFLVGNYLGVLALAP